MDNNEFLRNLQRQAEINPVLALTVAAGVLTALGKLYHAQSESRNSRSWAREVKRRERLDRRAK